MNIVCVTCGAGVPYTLASLTDQAVMVCSSCGAGLRVGIQAFALPTSAAKPRGVVSPVKGRVVVAVDGEATREVIRDLLVDGGYDVVEAATGKAALDLIGRQPPALVLIDVGLSDMIGFEVCEAVKRDPANAGVKMILVAAIYNKVRYRRPPDNLFGADDFIERHEIEAELLGKVARLCGSGSASGPRAAAESLPIAPSRPVAPIPVTPLHPPASPRTAPPPGGPPSTISPSLVGKTTPQPSAPPSVRPTPPSAPPPSPPLSPGQEAALRLARIIVSDIALYYPKKVDEGVSQGTFFEVLKQEIAEGRRLYEDRRAPELDGSADLFQQTLEQFVATRKQLLERQKSAAA
ncbi:MAG: response regulator [Nitrospiria bacterium]